jgi:hypothetical protein
MNKRNSINSSSSSSSSSRVVIVLVVTLIAVATEPGPFGFQNPLDSHLGTTLPSNVGPRTSYPDCDLHGIPQSFQVSVGIVPQLTQNHCLPSPLQFVIHH